MDLNVSVNSVFSPQAEALFGESLKRKDRADRIRNAIKILTKFRFLFSLPCNMDKNVAKGDFDIVINDYVRARNVFRDSEVELFKKIYEEVSWNFTIET